MDTSNLANWKTTATALFTAFFGLVLHAPQHFTAVPILHDIAGYAAAGGLVMFGIVSADKAPTYVPDSPRYDGNEKV